MSSISAKTAILPEEILNKIFLEYWLNKYEDQVEKIDKHIQSIYQTGRDMQRDEQFMWEDRYHQWSLQQEMYTMGCCVSYLDIKNVADRIVKMERQVRASYQRIADLRCELPGLTLERDEIKRKVERFTIITQEFAICDERIAKIKARGLREEYE